MGDFTPRGRGWNAPTVEQTGRLYRQGIRAAHLLADVVPAPFADCADLVKILDQGQLGSCTAQATSQIIRAAMLRVERIGVCNVAAGTVQQIAFTSTGILDSAASIPA